MLIKCHFDPSAQKNQPAITYFCTLQLVDLMNKKRLSERFYFRFSLKNNILVSRCAVFDISQCNSSDVFLALQVSKSIFENSTDEELQQPHLCYYISIEDVQKGGLISCKGKEIQNLDNTDQFMLEVVPFEKRKFQNDLLYRRAALGLGENETVQTIGRFNVMTNSYPRFEFLHYLHLRIISADFSKIRLCGYQNVIPKNILVTVRVMESESTPITCIQSKSSANELVAVYNCLLSFGTKLKFSDDIKILLPLELSEKHHILLSFYHIEPTEVDDPKAKKKRKKSKVAGLFLQKEQSVQKILIGQSVISLVKTIDEHEQQFQAYLFKSLKGNYLEKLESQDRYPSRNMCTVATRLVSNLYPPNPVIRNFLDECRKLFDQERHTPQQLSAVLQAAHLLLDQPTSPNEWIIITMLVIILNMRLTL